MEIYINALLMTLSPQVVSALIGGMVGISIKSKISEYGWFYTIFISIGSIIAVGATSEYFYSVRGVTFIFAHMLLGTLVGLIGSYTLHAINIFTPNFAHTLVNKTGDKILEKVDKYADKF